MNELKLTSPSQDHKNQHPNFGIAEQKNETITRTPSPSKQTTPIPTHPRITPSLRTQIHICIRQKGQKRRICKGLSNKSSTFSIKKLLHVAHTAAQMVHGDGCHVHHMNCTDPFHYIHSTYETAPLLMESLLRPTL